MTLSIAEKIMSHQISRQSFQKNISKKSRGCEGDCLPLKVLLDSLTQHFDIYYHMLVEF